MDEQCTFSPSIGDHVVGASPTNPIIIEDHHVEPLKQERMPDSFKQNIKDCEVFYEAQSAFEGRLEFVEAQADSHPVDINLDGDQVLTRLPQAGSSEDGRVYTGDDGIDSSSKEIIQARNPEDGHSIKATKSTPNTRAQQENPMTDSCSDKRDKGSDKHRRRKSKVTFA